ncbi:hypothetical protein [Kitasatospora sp. NPDC057541]|uniref:hypothetical protein n=1 Tax=unclassified Kitasatospora TaxID=2633591 RepID=UPI0036A5C9C5
MTDTCPRCVGPLALFPGDLGGGSRTATDRSVSICGLCCTNEAVRDDAGLAPIPPTEWPVDVATLQTWRAR